MVEWLTNQLILVAKAHWQPEVVLKFGYQWSDKNSALSPPHNLSLWCVNMSNLPMVVTTFPAKKKAFIKCHCCSLGNAASCKSNPSSSAFFNFWRKHFISSPEMLYFFVKLCWMISNWSSLRRFFSCGSSMAWKIAAPTRRYTRKNTIRIINFFVFGLNAIIKQQRHWEFEAKEKPTPFQETLQRLRDFTFKISKFTTWLKCQRHVKTFQLKVATFDHSWIRCLVGRYDNIACIWVRYHWNTCLREHAHRKSFICPR